MPISEKQFAAMTKGTVHEGKYEKEEPPAPVEIKPKPRRKTRPSQTENLSGEIRTAIPIIAAIRILTTPVTWLAVAVLIAWLYYFINTHPVIIGGLFVFLAMVIKERGDMKRARLKNERTRKRD